MTKETKTGCLPAPCGCLGVIGILAVLAAIAIPSFNHIHWRAVTPLTKRALIDIAKQCSEKKANGEINPKFFLSDSIKRALLEHEHYRFTPEDGSCAGDVKGKVSAIKHKRSRYLDFPKQLSINLSTGERTCLAGDSNNSTYDEEWCKDGKW